GLARDGLPDLVAALNLEDPAAVGRLATVHVGLEGRAGARALLAHERDHRKLLRKTQRGPIAHLAAVDGLDLRGCQVLEWIALVDNEAGPRHAHEDHVDDLLLGRAQLPARHAE